MTQQMFADYEPLFSPCPFWFASAELLANVLHAETNVVAQLLAKYPDLPNLFDAPEATIPQRSACFVLLAHRKLIEAIDETFTGRYEERPSLPDVESKTLRNTHNLVAADAPVWVSEMYQVVQQLPAYLNASLPDLLRAGGYQHDNPEKMRAIELAVETLSSVEQIQALAERVLDEQLQRLVRRWSTGVASSLNNEAPMTKASGPKGFEGLPHKKLDFSRYMDNLTEKQRTAFSLKQEYGLRLAEVASRMGLDRKTAYEHIQAAERKIDQVWSGEKRRKNRAKSSAEE
jgi:hypothetical protein